MVTMWSTIRGHMSHLGQFFAKYMSNKGIQPIGGIFSSHGRRIGNSEMPEGLGFDTGNHVIIFVNLLMFFDQDKLEYQVEYPLTGGNKREGVLDKNTMREATDALIERGHVVKIVPEVDEAFLPTAQMLSGARRARARLFFIGAFTQLTTIEEWYLGIIPRRKCCLRSRQSANLARLQKTN
jgi:hypothetical protein